MDQFMAEALAEAAKGVGKTSPNPTVGAVIVRDGKIVGRGHHEWSRLHHAEIEALQQAGERARGATVYVTLEPCSHIGRTSPCANALVDAGVTRVVAAMQDPNPLVSGRGFEKLRNAGITVEIDMDATRAAEKLNEPFVHFMRTGLPLVTLKAALTLDGKIAAPEDNSGWITSDEARAHVQTLRRANDAILTGIGTLLADDCLLTDRSGQPRSRPLLRIVVDSQLRTPIDSKMVQSAAQDVAVVTTSAASDQRRRVLEGLGIQVLTFDGPGGRTDFPAIVQWLAQHRYQSLMIEAGSKVNWSALESGVVDRIYFYYAPKILGGLHSLPVAGGAGRKRRADAIRFHNVTVHDIAPDEFAVEAWLIK
jgi:diaminohydroxyphosphoribosylaminopyrimidine deaminase / 5-amino-6-(5-phosphoribosylamino)uracil reductase